MYFSVMLPYFALGTKHAANWRNYREMLTETEQVFLLSIIPETE